MVDVMSNNGSGNEAEAERSLIHEYQLPEVLHVPAKQAQRVPSPGTLRALQAQTGKDWEALMGPKADAADRFQTTIWVVLRKEIPGLRWEDCADIELEIDDLEEAATGPLSEGEPDSATSPSSAASGG